MPTKPSTALLDVAAPALPAPDAVQPTAQALQDPVAGGNYVRCPITGALSPNPDFANATPTPQE